MTKNVKGVLGRKLGMTQIWDDANRVVPVTVIEAGPCAVTQVRTPEVDGYSAVQIGFGEIATRKVTRPMAGHFAKAGTAPKRFVAEIRTDDASEYEVGQALGADVFEAGQEVDVTGTTKGRGYAGVMKRHGFSGGPGGHGAHKIHRKPGSIGACATPGRVFKGTRMAGRMGQARHTVQNLQVVAVDADKGLLLVKGAVPGPKGGIVMVRNAVKRSAS